MPRKVPLYDLITSRRPDINKLEASKAAESLDHLASNYVKKGGGGLEAISFLLPVRRNLESALQRYSRSVHRVSPSQFLVEEVGSRILFPTREVRSLHYLTLRLRHALELRPWPGNPASPEEHVAWLRHNWEKKVVLDRVVRRLMRDGVRGITLSDREKLVLRMRYLGLKPAKASAIRAEFRKRFRLNVALQHVTDLDASAVHKIRKAIESEKARKKGFLVY